MQLGATTPAWCAIKIKERESGSLRSPPAACSGATVQMARSLSLSLKTLLHRSGLTTHSVMGLCRTSSVSHEHACLNSPRLVSMRTHLKNECIPPGSAEVSSV